jgi:hypothetical protein
VAIRSYPACPVLPILVGVGNCRQLGITEAEADKEVVELSGVTAVGNLARELGQKMPTDSRAGVEKSAVVF